MVGEVFILTPPSVQVRVIYCLSLIYGIKVNINVGNEFSSIKQRPGGGGQRLTPDQFDLSDMCLI